MRTPFLMIVCLAGLLTACVDGPVDGPASGDDADLLGTASLAIEDGTPEAIGLLALLNDPSTTLTVLDDDARLDARAAKNLLHHRDGFDRSPGTFDDNLFDDIAEVDAVRYVGKSAMARLLDFAISKGWVPQGDDQLGRWDGVSFTVTEAQRTLAYVNLASHDLIDHDLGMDRRTADSIVAAQPIASIEELAGLYYVGKTALTRFKAEAQKGAPVNYRDQFSYDEAREIPDGDNYGVTTQTSVNGVPDVVAGVFLVVDVRHDAPQQLQFELTDPNGNSWEFEKTSGQLLKLPLGSMRPANGRWTLVVSDPTAGAVGELYGWALEINTENALLAAQGRMALDLAWRLGHHYRAYGEDIARAGGNTLEEARAAIDPSSITEVLDPSDDPEGYDLDHVLVLRHADVVFPGSDTVWFAAYDRESSSINDVYSFE